MKIIYIVILIIICSCLSVFADWLCPDCSTVNKDAYNYCSKCGTSKAEYLKKEFEKKESKSVQCLNCNKYFRSKWMYCPYCGAVNYRYESIKNVKKVPFKFDKIQPQIIMPSKPQRPKKTIQEQRINLLVKSTFNNFPMNP